MHYYWHMRCLFAFLLEILQVQCKLYCLAVFFFFYSADVNVLLFSKHLCSIVYHEENIIGPCLSLHFSLTKKLNKLI